MTYLLDTNAWISYLNQPAGGVALHVNAGKPTDIALCSVVIGELRVGAYKSTRVTANLALLDTLQKQFRSLPFDDAAADQCAQTRVLLESKGTPIGPFDTQIAAIALLHGLILVTNNTAEFSRVHGLTLEDWTVP